MELTKEEKTKLYSILNRIKDSPPKDWRQHTNSNILLVDGTNLFIRGWAATNSMNENGDLVGGVVASLKSLGYAIKLLAPTRCIVVFDGKDGSFKRRKIFPEYKAHRKNKIRLNRSYEELSDAPVEEESCKRQYVRFVQYLQTLPVNLLSMDFIESDDVIAYLATDFFKESERVYIMSADRDFLQLCDGRIQVYSPTKKRIYGPNEVLADYSIHPNNFVLYRALDGDDSDDVPGIPLAGPKTIVKHFPWLNEPLLHTVDEIIKHADGFKNKYKVCENICNGKTILDRNVALMQLKETALTTVAQLHCNEVLQTAKIPMLDRNAFFKMVREDGIDSNLPNHINWLQDTFVSLDSVVRKE